jgi:alcohol dehydrogenase class IV
MLGSMYAGMAFTNAILGAVHAMAHSLGGLSDLAHGLCNAILLDHVVEANFLHAGDRYADLARAMGADIPQEAADEKKKSLVLETFRSFKAEVGVTSTLSDLGVRREDLMKLAELAACDPCMHTNPCEKSPEEILEIYEQAL